MTTVGEALVHLLESYDVDTVFGIPGVHTIELYRGLAGSNIRHITPRHEQGAGFMADGYARATGKPGVAFVITGPGHHQYDNRHGAGPRRFDPDAGDLRRQPARIRSARAWVSCTNCPISAP